MVVSDLSRSVRICEASWQTHIHLAFTNLIITKLYQQLAGTQLQICQIRRQTVKHNTSMIMPRFLKKDDFLRMPKR